jgi:hypothetical protein
MVFSVGPVLLALFMLKLLTGRKARREIGMDPSLVPAE